MNFSILMFVCLLNQSHVDSKITIDYTVYHEYVNKAESAFFLNNNVDSSLQYYDKAFSRFQFVFVHDAVNAAQIALFSKRPYKKYLKLGFKNGLKLEHLMQIPMLKGVYNSLKSDTELLNAYKVNRKEYLRTIDFDYLNWLYSLAIEDQHNKNLPRMKYEETLESNLHKFIKMVKLKGFPSSRLIGICDSTIFKEVGNINLDLSIKKLKYKELSYFNTDDNILSSNFALIFLVHHPCSYVKIENILLEEIQKGNIHPREVGLLYDNLYRFGKSNSEICPINFDKKGVYLLNLFTQYNVMNCSENQINFLRNQLSIVPINIDKIKKEFEQKQNFKLFWGFWDCL